MAELATCGFVGRDENVVLQGLTGTGKTYLACALAKAACARRVRSCYVRQPDLEDLWRESCERPGGERKLVRKYGAFGLLVVDEWLLDRPDTEFRSMLSPRPFRHHLYCESAPPSARPNIAVRHRH